MFRCSIVVTLALVASMSAACGDSDARFDAPTEGVPSDVPVELPEDAPIDAPVDAPIDAPPDAPPAPLPDLTFVYSQMAASLRISSEAFGTNACVLNECLARPGLRRLLRFDTMVTNQGTAALVLGAPNTTLPQWKYDSCHMHYHYVDFANYTLVNNAGAVIAQGHKQAFCLRDDRNVGGTSAPAVFDCSTQGLTPGWADLYSADLDCQFIDITDVVPGDYVLRIELNPGHTITELDYNNNIGLFPVTIP